ncbi:hypothetical protein ACT7C5_09845 [Bacillus pacificus]
MKLVIHDYSKDSELNEAIGKYYTLLRMTLDTNIYKVYETKDSQIFKSINNGEVQQPQVPNQPASLVSLICLAKDVIQIWSYKQI